MPGAPAGRTFAHVDLRRTGRRGADDSDLPWIYGAAVKASATHEAACRAAAAGIRAARERTAEPDRKLLMACTVRAALADSPCLPFAALPPLQREAVGLARIAELDVDEIAALVGCHRREAKRRMLEGLRLVADGIERQVVGA
jgi:hypothetical protein